MEIISYKDPEGYIVTSGGRFLRHLSIGYAPVYEHLMGSGLYRVLVDEGLLIPHHESQDQPAEGVYKVLIPEQIEFVSYPYEWCFSQWKDTLLLCLRINRIALEYGMILKDATPFNFTRHKGKITFFDTSSFQLYEEGRPWIAYKQFCGEFLGPLALMNYRSPSWSFMFSAAIRGFDLGFVSRQLPRASYLNMTCLLHLHMHSRYKSGGGRSESDVSRQPGLNKQKLLLLWQMIERGVSRWAPAGVGKGFWSDYYAQYIDSQVYIEDKKQRVTQWLRDNCPGTVIDLGANTGTFSLIAAAFAKEVIAVEADPYCVDQLYKDINASGNKNITPILADLTNPPSGLGWDNEERPALFSRLNGDMLMALALIHHLCITYNVPLTFVSTLFARLSSQYAIVEFIPKSDEKIKAMLRHREDIFTGYSEEAFRSAFGVHFDLLEEHACRDSDRKLFLWKKR